MNHYSLHKYLPLSHFSLLLHVWFLKHFVVGDDMIKPASQEYCSVVPTEHLSDVIQLLELLWVLSIVGTGQTGTEIKVDIVIISYIENGIITILSSFVDKRTNLVHSSKITQCFFVSTQIFTFIYKHKANL